MNRKPVFEEQEYRQRVKKVKERMDARGLEVILTMDPANMNYLSGYDGWSFYVHQGVLLGLGSEQPIWFGREQDSNGARITTWLEEQNIHGYPDEYVQSRYTHTMKYVAGLMKELGWEKKAVGLEMDNYWFSAKCYTQLLTELPQAAFHDATYLVNWVRTVKTPAEIHYMRQAARICEKAMRRAIDNIEAGKWEKSAAAKTVEAQIEGTDEYGGDCPAIFPIMPAAERTSTAHLTFDPERKYRKGDVVLLEIAGARCRYHAPLSRTVYLGKPPADLEKVAGVVINGLNATLEFIKPGVTAEEVEARWRESLKGTGVEKPSRVGYAYGLNYVPDWGEHTVSLRPGDKSILKPGMTIHFMPGIWLKDYGFENSEPLLITEKGCEKFIDFPQKLFIK